MTLTIGLTGGIASGKSTVSTMCREMGIPVIDADIEARLAVEPGEPAYKEIIAAFGENILMPDGGIDRPALGTIIFNDNEKRLKLNSIVHPQVRKRMNLIKEEAETAGESIIILDIPLLFESRLEYMANKIIVVYVDPEVQLRRLMERNSLTKEEAEARINSQMPLREKAERADAVINNNGTLEELKQQLLGILSRWKHDA